MLSGGHAPAPAAGPTDCVPEQPSPPSSPVLQPRAGWFSGLISGAGKLISSVLGSDSASPSPSPSACSTEEGIDQGEHCSYMEQHELSQRWKETKYVDHAELPLAIVSEVDTKCAIEQLLMQETYSWEESVKLINIINSRVVEPESVEFRPLGVQRELKNTVARDDIPLPIAWQTENMPETLSPSTCTPNLLSHWSIQTQAPDVNSVAVMEAKNWLEAKRSPTSYSALNDREPCTLESDTLQFDFEGHLGSPVEVARSYMKSLPACYSLSLPFYNDEAPDTFHSVPSSKALKRSYVGSISEDNIDKSRRVRPRFTSSLANTSKFKKTDFIRVNSGKEGLRISRAVDQEGLPSMNIMAAPANVNGWSYVKDHRAAVNTVPAHSFCHESHRSACSIENKNQGPHMEREEIEVCIPYESCAMDRNTKEQEDPTLNGSCSLSKLMLKEDIDTAPSSLAVLIREPDLGSKTRRKRLAPRISKKASKNTGNAAVKTPRGRTSTSKITDRRSSSAKPSEQMPVGHAVSSGNTPGCNASDRARRGRGRARGRG